MDFSAMRSKILYSADEEKLWNQEEENAEYIKQFLPKEGGLENPPEITGADEEFLDNYFAKYGGSLEGLQIDVSDITSETLGGFEDGKIMVVGDFYEDEKTGGNKETASTVNPQIKELFGVEGGANAQVLNIPEQANDLYDTYPQDLIAGGAYSFDDILDSSRETYGGSFASIPEPGYQEEVSLEEAIEKSGGEYPIELAGPFQENPSYPEEDAIFGGDFDGPNIDDILN